MICLMMCLINDMFIDIPNNILIIRLRIFQTMCLMICQMICMPNDPNTLYLDIYDPLNWENLDNT